MTDHVPPAASTVATTIARGANPPWTQTFEHPKHGPLTFTSKLPTAGKVLAHSIALDERLAELGDLSTARAQTLILASALAGMQLVDGHTGEALMLVLPELVDQRREEPQESGSTLIIKSFYNAEEELNAGFVIDVWTAFSAWREATLGEIDAVKGPSGEISGSGSSTESSAPTVSPSTTPA